MIPETGPYLKAAAICSDVIEGKDGVLSLIRIIDRSILTAAGPDAPEEMPVISQTFKVALMFVSGRARGTQSVVLSVEKPDTARSDVWSGTVFFEGEDRGANCIIEIQMKFDTQGLYWFEVRLDGSMLTRLPYRLIYDRAPQAFRAQ